MLSTGAIIMTDIFPLSPFPSISAKSKFRPKFQMTYFDLLCDYLGSKSDTQFS